VSTGKRAVEQGTAITLRAIYRNDLTVASETDPTADIPILDTRYGPNQQIIPVGQPNSDFNMYGKDARILLYVFLNALTSATLTLWLRAPVTIQDMRTPDEVSSDSSDTGPTLPVSTGEWVQVAQKLISNTSLWVIADIPPGEYKVLLTSWVGNSGTSFVTLLEQHAA
jgi:hypothetical protein